jgi:hypothetical protein
MSVKKVSVEKEFIIEAHRAANSEWKDKLERQFPELFDDGVVKFPNPFEVTGDWSEGVPFYIGKSHAPSGMANKCLVVRSGYQVEVAAEGGRQILVFKKK